MTATIQYIPLRVTSGSFLIVEHQEVVPNDIDSPFHPIKQVYDGAVGQLKDMARTELGIPDPEGRPVRSREDELKGAFNHQYAHW